MLTQFYVDMLPLIGSHERMSERANGRAHSPRLMLTRSDLMSRNWLTNLIGEIHIIYFLIGSLILIAHEYY